MIKVYIELSENNIITEINSEIFLDDISDYIQIDEGIGDRYSHAQNNYLPNGLVDSQGRYNYKYVDGKIVELSEDEKSSLFPNNPDTVEDTNDEISGIMEGMIDLTQQVNELSEESDVKVDMMEALIDLSNRLDKLEASLNK